MRKAIFVLSIVMLAGMVLPASATALWKSENRKFVVTANQVATNNPAAAIASSQAMEHFRIAYGASIPQGLASTTPIVIALKGDDETFVGAVKGWITDRRAEGSNIRVISANSVSESDYYLVTIPTVKASGGIQTGNSSTVSDYGDYSDRNWSVSRGGSSSISGQSETSGVYLRAFPTCTLIKDGGEYDTIFGPNEQIAGSDSMVTSSSSAVSLNTNSSEGGWCYRNSNNHSISSTESVQVTGDKAKVEMTDSLSDYNATHTAEYVVRQLLAHKILYVKSQQQECADQPADPVAQTSAPAEPVHKLHATMTKVN